MAWTTPMTATTGALYTAAQYNANTRDNMNYLRRICVRKTADESVTSSTTPQNDDELLFPILANEVWVFEFCILYDGGTTGDIQTDITGPSGTMHYGAVGQNLAATGVTFNSDTGSGSGSRMDWGCTGTGQIIPITIFGSITNGVTAGNVQFQWAQSTSNGTATTVRAGSFVTAHRIA